MVNLNIITQRSALTDKQHYIIKLIDGGRFTVGQWNKKEEYFECLHPYVYFEEIEYCIPTKSLDEHIQYVMDFV